MIFFIKKLSIILMLMGFLHIHTYATPDPPSSEKIIENELFELNNTCCGTCEITYSFSAEPQTIVSIEVENNTGECSKISKSNMSNEPKTFEGTAHISSNKNGKILFKVHQGSAFYVDIQMCGNQSYTFAWSVTGGLTGDTEIGSYNKCENTPKEVDSASSNSGNTN